MALVIRLQLEHANNTVVSAESYDRLFTMHGTTMIFLFVVPVMAAFGNYLVPLQIGARDMAFPRLNAASFWLLLFGGLVMYSSFVWGGGAADAGWTAYPPLSVLSPGHGLDLWIVGLHILGISSLIGAINFICTIHNMRAPGMRLTRMPLFTWAIDIYAVMIVLAGPVLAGALTMLLLDRNYGTSFYQPATHGPILYQHLFWFYSHPVVYVMALPGFGMISEIVPVFSRKPLFGYRALVYSIVAIAFLGLPRVGPPHVRGRLLDAAVDLVHAGLDGDRRADGRQDLQLDRHDVDGPDPIRAAHAVRRRVHRPLHDRRPVGHLPGRLPDRPVRDGQLLRRRPLPLRARARCRCSRCSAACTSGIPKMSGRMLDRALAIRAFWIIFVGFNMTFFPMHDLGLSGMPRRVSTYTNHAWDTANLISTIGAFVLATGVLMVLWNCIHSLRVGRIAPADPWGANSLEWYTSSPPPPHNFDELPPIRSERPLYDLRREAAAPAAGD